MLKLGTPLTLFPFCFSPFLCVCMCICDERICMTKQGLVITILFQKIMCEDSQCKTVLKYTSHCQSYIENCLKVCYFAAVQDPPMFLDFKPGEDTFDRQVYKEYTQMGTKVKFLVWPALFLHEGGALISKGVLQPIPDTN